MTNPTDAPYREALEQQHRELAAVLERLDSARLHLIPAPVAAWRGPARTAHDVVIHNLEHAMDVARDALRRAHRETRHALIEVSSRA
jgi:uncharacterized protein YukE